MKLGRISNFSIIIIIDINVLTELKTRLAPFFIKDLILFSKTQYVKKIYPLKLHILIDQPSGVQTTVAMVLVAVYVVLVFVVVIVIQGLRNFPSLISSTPDSRLA